MTLFEELLGSGPAAVVLDAPRRTGKTVALRQLNAENPNWLGKSESAHLEYMSADELRHPEKIAPSVAARAV